MSSSPVTSKVGTLIVFRSGTESGRSAMPRCTWATFPADIFRIMRKAPSTRSGRLSRVVLPISFGTMLSKKGSVPALQHVGGGLQSSGLRFRRIGRRFGVEQRQRRHPPAIAPPELKQHIAANRNSRQRHAPQFGVIENPGDIGGMLLHGGRPFAGGRFTVSAQVGKDQLIARGQGLGRGQPEFMMGGKRMEQHQRRTASPGHGMQSRRRHS